MNSLQSRLSLGLLFSLIIAFSALWLLVSMNARSLAEEYIYSRLEHDAETILSTTGIGVEGRITVDSNRIDLVYNKPFSGHYYQINLNTQTIRSRSLWDQQLQPLAVATGEQLRSIQKGPEQQLLLVFSAGFIKQGKKINLAIAEDLNPIYENIAQFQKGFAVLASGMLFLLIIVQRLILRFSLKPIIRIDRELKLLEQGQMDKLSTDSPSELRPLINEINHLLAVMEQRLRRSRNALGDLAHAIKKPLTVIQQVVAKDEMSAETRNSLLKQTNAIYQLSDRILKRARLAGHTHSGALFSFTDDFPMLVKTLEMMYNNKNMRLLSRIPDSNTCPIDREDMLELLGNLLDNAYKWGERNIYFTVNPGPELRFIIEDDGRGADAEKIGELSKRGIRLDEQTTGHGFGLAIAADIVADYGGSIGFSRSAELGGFMAEVTIPVYNSYS